MAAVEGASRHGSSVGDTTHDLYRRYGKQIYAYCYHRLRSREEAEDAVQTTFMNAFRSLQRGATAQYEQAWLFKIAQNVCIARHTSASRRLRLETPNDLETLQEVVPAREGEEPLELIGIEEALEQMPENQRRAILLREWQGLSYREISDELGLSQAAVEMLIFRARRTLAGALEQPGEEKKRRVGRKVGSLGSVIGALKTLLGGGAAIKAVAVAAATVAVVGESASHTIVRPARHTSAPAPQAAVQAARVQPVAAVAAVARAARRPVKHTAPKPRVQRVVQLPTRTAPAPAVAVAPPVVEAPAAPAATPHEQPKPEPAKPAVAQPPTRTPEPPKDRERDRGRDSGRERDRGEDAAAPAPSAPAPTPAPVEMPTATTTTTTVTPSTTIEPQPSLDRDVDHGRFKKLNVPVQPAATIPAVPPAPTTTTTTATATPSAPPPLAVTAPVVVSSPPLPSVGPPARGKGLALGKDK
jgi:RNA polymerase sigma factor (sigma-70 family)